jgi:hypothetical protein
VSFVFSLSQITPKAITRLKRICVKVGSLSPHQNPSATPVSELWASVSLKKESLRAVTKTPIRAQNGPIRRAIMSALCIKASENISDNIL